MRQRIKCRLLTPTLLLLAALPCVPAAAQLPGPHRQGGGGRDQQVLKRHQEPQLTTSDHPNDECGDANGQARPHSPWPMNEQRAGQQ